MKTIIHSLIYLAISLCLFAFIPASYSAELYFIDAHSQVDEGIEEDEILQRMDAAGIRKTILSSRRKRRAIDVANWAESHPDKIIASVRIKGKHYYRNTKKYYKKLRKQVKSDRFNAMSEVILYHAQKGELAAEAIVYPDDPRVSAALDAAMENDWPLVIHIEFAAIYGDMRNNFYNKMAALISENPGHPFALNHMGQLNAKAVTELIKNHKNLYFIAAHSNPIAVQRSKQPWVNMFQGKELAADWKTLIIKHPDRFIFALDNVWAEHWRNDYKEQVDIWRHALQKLPPKVAHAVAHGNAERLWKLDE